MTREFAPDGLRRDARSVVTTGTFDGVHLGHQAIVRYLVRRAAAIGGVPTVVTFDPHPRAVLGGHDVPLLTTPEERAALLEALGVARFVVLPFTRDLSLLEPETYVEQVLLGAVGLRELVIGYDHRFGRARRGDRALLEALGARHGFSVDVIPEQVARGLTVSSSAIRHLLADEGDAAGAAALLGRPYRLAGTVVRGQQRGRQIGFPTANVQPSDPRSLVPATGVYAARVFAEGMDAGPEGFPAMLNVGVRPTFEQAGVRSVEAHLIGFAGDLYGRRVAVDFTARLRDERRFDGPDALAAQLREDRAQALRALAAVA
ncbi:MAG: bifunctional riboflavin kinase/FAD synthetase [Rubricoccaceae bacterium]